jgi:hypothetical protein
MSRANAVLYRVTIIDLNVACGHNFIETSTKPTAKTLVQ